MLRATLLALLMASAPSFLDAQKGAGMGPAHGGTVCPNFGGHTGGAGNSQGFAGSRETGHGRHQRDANRFNAFPYFLPDYETGWPEDKPPSQEPNRAASVDADFESHDRAPLPPVPAQVIEIPNTSKNIETRFLPATVFVLTNGEKLESQRYLLTASNVSLTLNRNRRTIPLQMIDLDATIAANRDRGIDLRIPNDRNEISLRF